MKGSSQQRSANIPPNRLNKTQTQPPPKPDYLDNTYQGQKKPNPPPTSSTLPPRAGSTQKINYKIAEHMTNSKIQQAKQGLQLLKKKMSRNGMSRDKGERNNTSVEKHEPEAYNPKKTVYKPQEREEQYYEREQEIKKPTPKVTAKRSGEDVPKKTPPISTKSIEERPIKRQTMHEQFVNPNEEAPIKGNQDFMAILQRQMAKQNLKSQPQKQAPKGPKRPISYEQEQNPDNIELIQCTKGCGRQFNVTAIQKHEKVCEKVFLSKRKVFNSAAFRQPETQQDFKQPPPPPPIREQKQKSSKNVAAKQQKVPKWKLQSAAFRAGLKQGRGQSLTAEEKAMNEQASGKVQCGTCGRKFNEQAGKRHIAFCESKAKQMPKMNTSKRK